MLYAYRLHRALHDRRPDGAVPRRARRSTCTSPTPTSSSRTSTTSWSAARSWAISAACTTGGRRSAAACTTRGSRRSAPAIIFVGFNLTFFPQFILGYLGMPRRYHAYPPEFQVLNVLSSAGASILGVGYLIPMIYLMWSLRYGRARRLESVGRGRPRVDDDVAAADGEFRGDADRDLGRVRLSDAAWRATLPETPPSTAAPSGRARAPLRQPRAAERGRHARHVGVPRHRGAVLRRPVR